MNIPYEEIRIRRLARDAITRKFPNGDINLMLRDVTPLENSVVVGVNARPTANAVKSAFVSIAYQAEILNEEADGVQVRISR
ncbi:hypothetical protein [Streptomyces sp. 5-10]|uniref:hypothetical protein n=1 Tax=Streptomyces sp. 5-10 TaxID=878925 RepID=UPI00168AAA6E|nr:hypothetical protein [Streptomyces sp. 5-10]MBD3004806.1 hypothetical protein [Streptomyces sp. 5-10]